MEGFLGKLMLQRIYREELDLLAGVAESQKEPPASAPSDPMHS